MSWRKLESTFFDDYKFVRLAQLTGEDEVLCQGRVARAWSYALRHFECGRFNLSDIPQIEHAVRWPEERAGEFVGFCINCGLIDELEAPDADGFRFGFHNWLQRGGSFTEKIRKNRWRKTIADREIESMSRDRDGTQTSHGHRCHGLDQIRYRSDQSKEKIVEKSDENVGADAPPADKSAGSSYTPEIRQVREHYISHFPQRKRQATSKPAATKIRARLKEGYRPEDLCKAIDGMVRSHFHQSNGHDSLELAMRDAAHVDRFLAMVKQAESLENFNDWMKDDP